MPAPRLHLMRAALASVILGSAVAAQSAAAQTTVSIACGSVGIELEGCRKGAQAWAAKTGNHVRVVSTPRGSSETLAQYQQLLSARSADIDVLRIDVVWPGLLARHLVDLGPLVGPEVVKRHFPAVVQANTVDGRLVALPWFTDVGLLFFRKDLLEKYGRRVPGTWQELADTAKVVQQAERKAGNARMWGFVFEGRAYEGLTCNALEWVDSFGGGTVVDEQGRVTIHNARAVEAIALAASWVKTIAPMGVLNYAEEEARAAFQSGNSVFMRSWPYAWALVNAADSAVSGKVGISRLPSGGAGGKRSGTLGGWQLAVSTYSRNVNAAVDLVLYLTSLEEQKRAALTASLNPTIPSLYDDPAILRANPFYRELREAFASAVARPSRPTGDRYNQVSSAFWNAVHDALSGAIPAEESLASLERTLNRISRVGRW